MDDSSASVSVSALLEAFTFIDQKLDRHQQMLNAVIQHQQHLEHHHHQLLLLQRHSSFKDIQAPLTAANEAPPASPAATAQVASPETALVAALADCPAHTARHTPAAAGSSGQRTCCAAAATSPAASLVHTHMVVETVPASGQFQQGLDTASSKQQHQEQLLLRGSNVATKQLSGQHMQPADSTAALHMQLQQTQQQLQLVAEAGAAPAVAGTQQGDSAAPGAGGADALNCLSRHASAPQLCRHKSSAFLDQQQQILHSCSSGTAEALLSISCDANWGSNSQQGSAVAAVAAGAPRQPQHADATSQSELMPVSSTEDAVAAPCSLYVGRPDPRRFAFTESLNTLVGSQQHNTHTEQAARAAQLQHHESVTSLHFGVDLQHSMSSQSQMPERQHVGSPAAGKYSQNSPLLPQLQPMSASSGRSATAAATAGLITLPGAGSQGWQAVHAGQQSQLSPTGSLAGAAVEPIPTLMPPVPSALQKAWTVPAPSTAGQSSNGGSPCGWTESLMCAGADMAATQRLVLQQRQSYSYPQQQWRQMPAGDEWQPQQQVNASLQRTCSGPVVQALNTSCAWQQSDPVQPVSASAYAQQHQAAQPSACGAAAGNRGSTATAAAVAAAHAAAKFAAAAAQQAGIGAGLKRKHYGTAHHASKSQCNSSSKRSGEVLTQKHRNYSFTSLSSGMPQVGLKMSRTMSTSVLHAPPQSNAHSAAASSLAQFPTWLLQHAYKTLTPMTCTANTAATAQQRGELATTSKGNTAASAATTTQPPAAPIAAPAPPAVAGAAAAAAGYDMTDDFFVDDVAACFNNDQDTAAGTLPCASMLALAPTVGAAAAAAGVNLPTASGDLDNAADTAAVGTLPAGGDGLGAAAYVPTGGFMQMLQEPLCYSVSMLAAGHQ